MLACLRRFLSGTVTALYLFWAERKRITPLSIWKILWFSVTFPRFALIGRICTFLALFQKVEWKPIPHTSTVKIDDLPVR